MKKSLLCLALSLVALPALSFAQGPTARPGIAVVSGENPYIRLQDKEGGKMMTVASLWHVTWSPAGRGSVCYITVGEAGEPGQVRIALYDNEQLFKYLTNDVLAVSDKSVVERPFTPVPGAKFSAEGDNLRERTEICQAPSYNIRLSWHDLKTPELLDRAPGAAGYGMTYLRILGTTADVTINGKAAPGTAYGRAALAYGETWLKAAP